MTVVRLSNGRVAALLRAARLSHRTVFNFSATKLAGIPVDSEVTTAMAVIIGCVSEQTPVWRMGFVELHNTRGGNWWPVFDRDQESLFDILQRCRNDLRNGVAPLLGLSRCFNACILRERGNRVVTPDEMREIVLGARKMTINAAFDCLDTIDVDIQDCKPRYKSEVVE